jgi:predicted flap endonuclease-1-like 5' DNA nuclease
VTETTTIFTMAQFGLIGLFAILAIVGILFGMRLKRRRIRAEKEVDAHREAAIDTEDGQPARVAPPPPAARSLERQTPAAAPIPVAPAAPIPAAPISVEPAAEAPAPEYKLEPQPAPVAPAAPVPTPTPAAPPPTDRAVETAEPTPAPTAPASTPLAGDITQLKGLGPKLAATLAGLGITRVDQIAAMSPADLADLDARLGAFKGRPTRDRWAEQAALLVAGNRAAYEAEFGKLG